MWMLAFLIAVDQEKIYNINCVENFVYKTTLHYLVNRFMFITFICFKTYL